MKSSKVLESFYLFVHILLNIKIEKINMDGMNLFLRNELKTTWHPQFSFFLVITFKMLITLVYIVIKNLIDHKQFITTFLEIVCKI